MVSAEALQADAVVIGAGVIGLAVARALALAGREVVLLESGPRFGEGLSSRNSEVIHAGIYYPAPSLKAKLCVAGREALYRYCQSRHIAHRRTGKWIIATQSGQETVLDQLEGRARGNGVALERISSVGLRRGLPDVRAVAALYSPETGIVDSHGLMLALMADLEAHGGQLVRQAPVVRVESGGGRHRIEVGGEAPCELIATSVVNSAGLGAIPLAATWDGYPAAFCPRPYYAKGTYFSYAGRHPFNSLVYPVPEPGGLGIHLTLDLAGQARFGPDVEWVLEPDFTVDFARRQRFSEAVRSWWPGLDPGRLQPAYAGVRPKLRGPEAGFTDFEIQDESIHGVPGLVHLFGMESPGLTACLAIAERVARRF